MADDKDKKLYSYKEALEQPHWVRSFGSFYTFATAFKFSRIVYTVLVFVPAFILLMILPFMSWNYSLVISFVVGLAVAYAIEDLKIDGRPFIYFFKDYLIYYFTYGHRANEIYINKGKIYRRYDKKGEK
ncbi:TcpE family conjugal transfer membrane protein [Streptococcus sp. S784/96/1]|uniref:TcpE family conjugal transfer membrane protein n=1 Tax=Streptococcus sp. S784/96/1 TaxID=2653499 RepID=UPI001387668C|nr:TcpE family conjugal transfer membrane protein [Streptococcus sp. S784/96/1]